AAHWALDREAGRNAHDQRGWNAERADRGARSESTARRVLGIVVGVRRAGEDAAGRDDDAESAQSVRAPEVCRRAVRADVSSVVRDGDDYTPLLRRVRSANAWRGLLHA